MEINEKLKELIITGFLEQLNATKKLVDKIIGKFSRDKEIEFPDTAYNFPLFFGLTGKKIFSLIDIQNQIEIIEKTDKNNILDCGINTVILEEFYKALQLLGGEQVNFIPDTILRSLGVQLVSSDISGIAVILGSAPTAKEAVKIIRGFQEKNILSILIGNCEGETFAKQLEQSGIEISLATYIVNCGDDTESAALAMNFAIRAALTFGGIEGGQKEKCLEYCRNRIPAFVLALKCIDAKKVATAAGAIAFGFPVITNFDVPKISFFSDDGFEKKLLSSCNDLDKIVDYCIETREIKIKITKIDIPVKYGPAFEGERVRKEEMYIEFGGKHATALELVKMVNFDEIQNKKIQVIGKEIDEFQEGTSTDLAMIVRVAGKKMQKDFEPILERQIHRIMNFAMGIMHTGQRNFVWLRISKQAKKDGFKLFHLGEIICSKLLSEYGEIIDKIEVDIITDSELVKEYLAEAQKIYSERDKRIGEMTDESVEEFYSCLLCQSFAPTHVCIITPERLGLCGAYNWLDGKAAYQIKPTGANQPVKKGKVIDANLGQWEGVNDFVYKNSNKTIERFSAYSFLVDPMTSCGCFECVIAILPGTCGFMVVDRSYQGMTPAGMTFLNLANIVGGGKQNPGFIGIGINYIISKKFLFAEGGLKRLVWMPKNLKEQLREDLIKRSEELGEPDLIDKIADETITTDLEGLINFLTEKNHPALTMGELI
ncbi:MAG TPA: acetyl-CoA decarbonylase/synthase complex subunit alpha/beta [bacterium]|nr:acetyl-CoA decarbonylase/synthase complex subunit alpha/beta [bacterium]HOL46769.1 acetyl-CoA decarbonylase/synthase complex subunit alpha/beta [bacterium]HPQ17724.1 acetyl-CoA decarbonylase/synthase complex subunit alpha/beta [bacterium]